MADATLHKLGNCSKELASYLEAKYTCVPGAWVDGRMDGWAGGWKESGWVSGWKEIG